MSNELPNYRTLVHSGDMVLCRVNAPLVSECFKFLKEGRAANIQGRDVGTGLISTIKKLMKGYEPAASDVSEMVEFNRRLSEWLHAETAKENAKRNPSDSKLIALEDRHDCLMAFAEGAKTTEEVIKKIETVFTDERNGSGIRLSSVHKAKGLEASRVFLLEPEGATIPHPMAKTPWQREQELHLRYVAITRAITELVYVS